MGPGSLPPAQPAHTALPPPAGEERVDTPLRDGSKSEDQDEAHWSQETCLVSVPTWSGLPASSSPSHLLAMEVASVATPG